MHEIVVVGGGLAGLASAAALARAGHAVRVIEAGRPGGRAASTRREGFVVNLGAHALYRDAERELSALGVSVRGGHPRPQEGAMLLEGALHPPLFGAGAIARTTLLSRPGRARVLAALATLAAGRRPPAGQSVAEWIAGWVSEPRGRELLSALVRVSSYLGRLEQAPASIGIGALAAGIRHPVRYVDGGWTSLVEGLAAQVPIETGTRVEAVSGQSVLLAGGQERPAAAVILAGLSPARARRLLAGAGGELPAEVGAQPVLAATLDVALDRLPRPEMPFVLGLDEPVYLSVHSRWSRLTTAPGAVVQLMRYDDGSELSDEARRASLEAVLDLAQPGWREQVRWMRFAPRMRVVHHLPEPARGLAGRPGVGAGGVTGVLLAGDWVGSRGWLAASVLASAREAAGRAAASAPRRPVALARAA